MMDMVNMFLQCGAGFAIGLTMTMYSLDKSFNKERLILPYAKLCFYVVLAAVVGSAVDLVLP